MEGCEARLHNDSDGICMIRAIADVGKVHLGAATCAKAVNMAKHGGLLWCECLKIIREAPEFAARFPPNRGGPLLIENGGSLRLPYDGRRIALRKVRHDLFHAIVCEGNKEREAVNPPTWETCDNGELEHNLFMPNYTAWEHDSDIPSHIQHNGVLAAFHSRGASEFL